MRMPLQVLVRAALGVAAISVAGCESERSSALRRQPNTRITEYLSIPPAAVPAELGSMALEPLDPYVDVNFRGLSVVDERTVWIGGSEGTVLKTLDGGERFFQCFVPGGDQLDFRDVQAFDQVRCLIMSAGPGDSSRIYKTVDGGANWSLTLRNPDESGFFDGMSFWDDQRGLVYGDPVDGHFYVARTTDGGASWEQVPPDSLPAARNGEAGFAASGTGITTHGSQHAWFCTGGAGPVRVFHTEDGGTSWEAIDTSLEVKQASAGGFSLTFFDESHGVLVGGDYLQPYGRSDHCAVTADGGRSWLSIDEGSPGGHRACVAYRPGVETLELLSVGRAGVDLSLDGGVQWSRVDAPGFYCVEFGGMNFAFLTGSGGRLARLVAPTP